MWFIGGYPVDRGHVWVFDLVARTWRAGPELPFALHHQLASSFEHAGDIVVVGGMIHDGAVEPPERPHRPFDGFLRLRPAAAAAGGGRWEVTPSPVPVGGITQCAAVPGPNNVRYCYAGSREYHAAPFTFFEFDPVAMRARPLPPPPPEYNSTHVNLFHDAASSTVHMLVGRLRGHRPASAVLVYDLAARAWERSAPGAVPFAALEGRAGVHLPGARVAIVMGGQDVAGDHAGDSVLQYDLRTRAWAHVDDLPQQLLGAAAAPLGGGRVLVAGGGVAVGPAFSNRAYIWRAGALLTVPADPRVHCAAPGAARVLAAHCGAFDVTAPLAAAVAAGRRAFAPGWCASAAAVGGDEPEVPRALAVQYTRCGRAAPRRVYCTEHAGRAGSRWGAAGEVESCRLSI